MGVRTVGDMATGPAPIPSTTVTVLLRLATSELQAGRLVGGAELVATGERAVVRGEQELIEFLRLPRPRKAIEDTVE